MTTTCSTASSSSTSRSTAASRGWRAGSAGWRRYRRRRRPRSFEDDPRDLVRVVVHRDVAEAVELDPASLRHHRAPAVAVAGRRDDPVLRPPGEDGRDVDLAVTLGRAVADDALVQVPVDRAARGALGHGDRLGGWDAVAVLAHLAPREAAEARPAHQVVQRRAALRHEVLPAEEQPQAPRVGAGLLRPAAGRGERDDGAGTAAPGQLERQPAAERVADDVRGLEPGRVEVA